MRHVRSLGFDGLEPRQLLSKAHLAVAQAVVAAPLVLDGTLTANQKAATSNTNADGSMTTSVPVAGELAGLGEIRGIWNESQDAYGNYMGPDTLQLHDPHGTFVVAFNTANKGKPHRTAQGSAFYELPQRLLSGSGAYARTSESGVIELNSNRARTAITSITLATSPT